MEQINEFQYQVLLATLESIKGTKKPIKDFITRVLNFTQSSYRDSVQTRAYKFKLITRAVHYSSAQQATTHEVFKWIENTATILANAREISYLETHEVFEFYFDTIILNPRTTQELLEANLKVTLCKDKHFDLRTYNIIEFRPFSKPLVLIYLFLKQNAPNSTMFNRIHITEPSIKSINEAIAELRETHSVLHNMLNNLPQGTNNEHTNSDVTTN